MTSTLDVRPTFRLALEDAEKLLAKGLHPSRARRDSETLLLHALRQMTSGINLAWLIAHESDELAPDSAAEFRGLIERRLAGEPVQYIAGEAEFYGLSFQVNPAVLIPRPETELLVEKAAELAPLFRSPRILDVGTGSGAIAISLAHERPEAIVTAIDLSASALDMARRNAERTGLADRIRFLHGDLLDPVEGEQFDLIVSNPPYVAESDRATLDVEVRNYEPAQALFAGEDGFGIYRRLIPEAFKALAAGGILLLELGYGQQKAMNALLAQEGFAEVEFFDDLQGIPRVAKAQRR